MAKRGDFEDEGFLESLMKRNAEHVPVPPSMSRLLIGVAGLAVVATIVAVTWATWPSGKGRVDENALPVLKTEDKAYKIKPDATRTEYFMVEYRKQAGTFDVGLPSSGLLVYRITPENYSNLSGTSYEMYIFRPGGTTTVEGEVDNATLSAESGRTSVNGTTDANTLFYSDGTKAPFHISEVGSCGETISFKVTFDNTGVENVAGDIAKAFYDKQSQSIVASRDIKRIDCYTTSGQLIPTQGSDLSTLAKGMYIITVTYNDGQHENLKIIK